MLDTQCIHGVADCSVPRRPAQTAACERRLAAVRAEAAALEAELRDYRARAHALLKAKDGDLRAAKDSARCGA